MSEPTRLLTALLGTAVTYPGKALRSAHSSRHIDRVPGLLPQCDKESVAIPASRAERALRAAWDGFGEIIAAVPVLELGSDVRLLTQLLNLAAKLEAFRAKFDQLALEVRNTKLEVSNKVLKLRVMAFLRDVVKLFDPSDHVIQGAHSRVSCAIDLLRWLGDNDTFPGRDRLATIAVTMLEQETGIVAWTEETATPDTD